MNLPISRDEALNLVYKYNTEKSDINHYLESEAVLRGLAKHLGEDQDYYGMLGLIHDIDWGITKNDPKTHMTKAPDILSGAGFESDFIEVILSHAYGFDCADLLEKKRTKKIEHALACGETITGLIHAYALMRGGIKGMKVSGLKKKFKDKKFAAAVNREIIKECENLGISLDEIFKIAIESIELIANEVGLNNKKEVN